MAAFAAGSLALCDAARTTFKTIYCSYVRLQRILRSARGLYQYVSALREQTEDLKIFLYYIGKARDAHANAIAEEFVKRSGRYATCEMREVHPGRFDIFAKHAAARKVFLDPAGRDLDSRRFVALIEQAEREGQDLVFLVGGHDGLPEGWKPRADLLLSLSPMTFPHELARAMLAEQIYRAFTALRGHPYPR
jgi:23S rRNA (pseudouridine1915-N3)-methyltransferase